MSSFVVVISPTAFDMFEAVKGRRIWPKLAERIDALTMTPRSKGGPLQGLGRPPFHSYRWAELSDPIQGEV